MADQELFIPPTVLGVVYWKDHVLGVIDDPGRAEAAVAALVEAGFSAEDATAWTGAFVSENHRHFMENRGAFQRLAAMLPSGESEVGDAFVEEAGKGHSIVTVRAAEDAQARRAAALLRRHGARHLVHYRARTYVDL